MSESYIGKVLQAKLEFRDLSYIFVLVIEAHDDHLVAVQLPEHTIPDSQYAPPLYDIGTSYPHVPPGWGEERGRDPQFRLILNRTADGIVDNIHRVYELWDGLPKPYRFV